MNAQGKLSRQVLIMAGGTGGHIFPALAVATALRESGCQVSWLGTAQSMESRIVPENGIPLHTIDIAGIRGKGLLTKLFMPFRLIKATVQARKIIKHENPVAVLGFGGFVTGPGGLASWLSRIPLLIHEQNAIAGMTNRYLARFARHVYEAFPGSFPNHANAELVGNPIRNDIVELHHRFDQDRVLRKQVLVVGGSLGSKALNQVVPEALALLDEELRPEIKHQAGKKTIDLARSMYQRYKVDAEVVEFIDDMAAAYAWADLIICRAGALTVSEVTAAGLPAIFVPFPYAVDDHQFMNAESVASRGAAIVMREKDMDAVKLVDVVKELLSQPEKLKNMRLQSHRLARLDAAKHITEQCLAYVNSSTLEAAA